MSSSDLEKVSGYPPEAEYMHEPTDEPQFNESMYFNFVDDDSGFATLIRMGNRVNEGYAEVTVLVYLPGGGAAIHFERADIDSNDAFDAGGLRFDVVEPLEHLHVRYEGEAHILDEGTDLEDPKTAFTTSPVETMTVDLDYYDVIPVYGLGGEADDEAEGIAGGENTIATGHYQGPCRVSGTVTIGDEVHEVSGLGYRDHSWGPRKWQGPLYWRWISCLCDEENGFVGWANRVGDERPPGNGMVLRDGTFHLVKKVEISSTYGPPPHYPETLELRLVTDERTWTAKGEAFHIVPLRHRREGQTARLAEIICRYDFEGMTGFGISEYHDLMIDGEPAGMDEA